MSAPLTYLDYNATTPPDERVIAALVAMLRDNWANPSSGHEFGARAAVAVEQARRQVAAAINARETEIVFTSGGTEADNAALRGVLAARPEKRHLVISAVEHHAIFETAEQLEHEAVVVSRVPVDNAGRLDLDALADALRADTALVSIMLANNETGVIFPLADIARIAHERGVMVHTDAVNALGKTPVDVAALGVDLLSLSAHKIYGPKGVGALYIRRNTPFQKVQIGGSQERGRRGGTLNAPGIVALGAACQLVHEQPSAVNEAIGRLRDELEQRLLGRIDNVHIIGRDADRLPNTSCVCFAGCVGDEMVVLLSELGLCVSSGAACTAGQVEPSHVLRALRVPDEQAMGAIRFSLGRQSTNADIERALDVLPGVVEQAAAGD